MNVIHLDKLLTKEITMVDSINTDYTTAVIRVLKAGNPIKQSVWSMDSSSLCGHWCQVVSVQSLVSSSQCAVIGIK